MIGLADPVRVAEAKCEPEHVSASAAKSYLSCSLRFYFERVLELPRATSPSLHLGKAIHEALQAFHLAVWREQDASPEVVATAYEESFVRLEEVEGPVRWADDAEREKNRLAGLRVIAAYLDSEEALKVAPRGVEVMLKESLPGLQVPLTGVIDLVCSDYVPVDFKSAASTPTSAMAVFDHEIQLVGYQLLLEQATGEVPKSLDLVYLVKTKVPKVLRFVGAAADRARKDRVIRMLDLAVSGMVEGRFHPQPGMQCSWCSYRRECMTWTGAKGRRAA